MVFQYVTASCDDLGFRYQNNNKYYAYSTKNNLQNLVLINTQCYRDSYSLMANLLLNDTMHTLD